jgi:hypothetical protein
VASVDELYEEFRKNGVKILRRPEMKEYGSYEFRIEDIDGRQIGIGRIKDRSRFFENSNYIKQD